jgi:3-oxoacyl-[acyl-carrier protein] reductase
LEGKVALVTGAGKNIGRSIALTLARDGADIIVNGRSDRAAVEAVVKEVHRLGRRAVAAMGDVSDEDAVNAMVAESVAKFGGLDIVVSNAGLRRQTPFIEMTYAEWREILSVALDGAFLLCRAAVPHLIERGGGAIVGLSGVSTHVGTPNRCHVSASKAGLEGLMRALAVELAPHGIRCNSVAPGAIDTVRGAAAGALPSSLGNAGIPLGRKGDPQEIADTVRFLVGPESGYITGQSIHANGGVYLS